MFILAHWLPTIVLVGRPNVGKSTLFNRITRTRAALVADFPGLTRDRHYGRARIGERSFLVVDTGGFEPVATEGILHEMAKQTRQAIAESDVVVFLLDARSGLTDQDFRPDFEQKGIDLRIGLDIARIVDSRAADRLILVSADTDLIPAMDLARQSSLQLIGLDFPNGPLHGEILSHFDLVREVEWPRDASRSRAEGGGRGGGRGR